VFDDVLEANVRYRAEFHDSGVTGRAAKGLAVLTCIDSRIDPLAVLGLKAGDAKIIRNAGARATDDAIRSLVLAANLLDVTRICVVQHSECAMAGATDEQVRQRIGDLRGVDPGDWTPHAFTDQIGTLRGDIEKIAAHPLLPPGTEIGGFLFDVRSGALIPMDDVEG
jgi:carbonic anhydrase